MLIDLRRFPDETPQEAETLIIGAGAVGLAMAVELHRKGCKAIVLEAGGASIEADSQDYFLTARCCARTLPGLHLARFRALGGATNFWGGQLLTFEPLVLQHRPWVADIGWPIAREELDPYYQRGYALLGMDRHLADAQVWQRLGIELPASEGALEGIFSAWAPEPNFAALYGREIAASPNVRVFLNAPALALEMDAAKERILGVFVRSASGAARRFAARRVILANGTVEIARLLKLPLADGSAAPWANNNWLGRGFSDHVDCWAGEVSPLDKKRFHNLFDNAYLDGIKYAPKIKPSAPVQRERRLLGISGHFLFNSSFEEHIFNAKLLMRSLFRGRLERQLVPSARSFASMLRVALPMVVRYLRSHRMYNPADQGIRLRLCCEQFPLRESAVRLGDTRDRLGMPVVEMDWRVDGREVETMATFSEMLAAWLERHGLARLRLDPTLAARDPAFAQRFDDGYHHMGTARMADSSAAGVVDRNLKVFGTHNLYVAGAAVYPTTGSANPTFTAIALGLRLANAIGNDHASA
ncbi:MAG TPA: FAD-dependent oxidoreductase [Stellaceae bacterium]|nr:FAD-dependent oxidoreductase [Stellaceae bacterium]